MRDDQIGNRGNTKPPSRDANHHKGSRPPASGGKPPAAKSARAPEQTLEEVRYLKYLIENHIPVTVRLRSNEELCGTIEYYDQSFIRITREPEHPNLFVYKHDIKYIYESE